MSEGGPGKANVHAAWRMEVAERAAAAYAPNQRLAVFAVAGSVGTARADRFSDLEVDCYWHEPPEDLSRRALRRSPGGFPRRKKCLRGRQPVRLAGPPGR
jgi:hypothetical protein